MQVQVENYVREEPAVSCRWTGWVREQPVEVQDFRKFLPIVLKEYMEYTSND